MGWSRDSRLGIALVVLIGAIALRYPQFVAPASIADVLDDTSILMLLAFGQMLVILTRAIDLSAAANLALCGMIAALFNRSFPQAGIAPAMLLAVLSGTVLGAFNGLLVWCLRLPPIVVTLGTMSIFRGLIYVLSAGAWVNSDEMSPAFLHLARLQFLGLTFISWLAIFGALILAPVLRFTTFGRNFFAAGGSPGAAAYAGIDAPRMQFFAYTISGAIAGACGLLWVSRFAVAYTDVALGFELQVIAACLLGGISIAGGIGSVRGVVQGCLFLGVLLNALPLIGVSPFWQMAVNGAVIAAAAILNARTERRSGRALLDGAAP
jgi:rhamnose transport system permease protein